MIEIAKGFIGYDEVELTDDEVFTPERLNGWRRHLFESYKAIFGRLCEKVDSAFPVDFFLSESLVNEVIVDATIGMKKITTSKNNGVENPNAFKEAAYLAYWWLRHKPVSLHYPSTYTLEDVSIVADPEWSAEKTEIECKKLAWDLKHINELVAVQLVLSYLFDFSKEVCEKKACKRVSRNNANGFAFDSFDEMRNEAIDTLIYYFSYRAIAPKMIEQMLEAYTFHPAWALTGDLWSTGKR